MDEPNVPPTADEDALQPDETHPRPSLRGMGRRILTGEDTPTETDHVAAPPPTVAPPPPPERRPSLRGRGPQILAPAGILRPAEAIEAPPVGEVLAADAPPPMPPAPIPAVPLPPYAVGAGEPYQPGPAVEALEPAEPEFLVEVEDAEARPPIERMADDLILSLPPAPVELEAEPAPDYATGTDDSYQLEPAVEALTPEAPETVAAPEADEAVEALPQPDFTGEVHLARVADQLFRPPEAPEPEALEPGVPEPEAFEADKTAEALPPVEQAAGAAPVPSFDLASAPAAEPYEPSPAVDALTPQTPEVLPAVDAAYEALAALASTVYRDAEAEPPVEITAHEAPQTLLPAPAYEPPPAVDALTPAEPEVFAETVEPAGDAEVIEEAPADAQTAPPPEDDEAPPLAETRMEIPGVPLPRADDIPTAAPAAEAPETPYEPSPVVEALAPTEPETFAVEGEPAGPVELPPESELVILTEEAAFEFSQEEIEALPLAEADGDASTLPLPPAPPPLVPAEIEATQVQPYESSPAVEALAPAQPETLLAGAEDAEEAVEQIEPPAELPQAAEEEPEPLEAPAAEPAVEIGTAPPAISITPAVQAEPAAAEPTEEEPEPLEAPAAEPAVEIGTTPPAISITPAVQAEPATAEPAESRLPSVEPLPDTRWLVAQIESLQKKTIEYARGGGENAEFYQQMLLQATQQLHESPRTYPDVASTIERLRADLEQATRVQTWSRRYSGRLLGYLALLTAVIVILGLLEPPVSEATDRLGISPDLSNLYMPVLFGALGAVFGAFWVLVEQLYIHHDFDPSYVAWYFLTPIIGLLSGTAMYIFVYAVVTSSAALIQKSSDGVFSDTPYLMWALCFAAGMLALLIWGKPKRKDPASVNTAGPRVGAERNDG